MAAQADKPASNEKLISTPRWMELRRRTYSGVVMASIAIAIVTLGGVWFTLAALAIGFIMHREWQDIMPYRNVEWRLAGIFYIVLPCLSVLYLRNLHFTYDANGGFAMMLYLIAVVTATDVFAFFGGRTIGGPKLAPGISPNKTWAGAFCGVLVGCAVGCLFLGFLPFPNALQPIAILSLALSVLAQLGDLFESWLKRRANVKDSGKLLPGHGGLLDRMDGYMFTAPLLLLLCLFLGDLVP